MFDSEWRDAPIGAVIVRTYKEDKRGKLQHDLKVSAKYGWRAEFMGVQPVHIGIVRRVLTIGVIFNDPPPKAQTTVQYIRAGP